MQLDYFVQKFEYFGSKLIHLNFWVNLVLLNTFRFFLDKCSYLLKISSLTFLILIDVSWLFSQCCLRNQKHFYFYAHLFLKVEIKARRRPRFDQIFPEIRYRSMLVLPEFRCSRAVIIRLSCLFCRGESRHFRPWDTWYSTWYLCLRILNYFQKFLRSSCLRAACVWCTWRAFE